MTDRVTLRLPESACPSCGKHLDAATLPGDVAAQPGPGDISICFYCGAVNVFSADLRLRKITVGEYNRISEAARDYIKVVQRELLLHVDH